MSQDLTEGLIDAGGGLYLDDQGNFRTVQEGSVGDLNQWMWGEEALTALGGDAELAAISPFLSIQEQYQGGAPIEAETWEDAVRKSLTGFMRADYGADPAFMWNPEQSGLPGSQYRIGTLQDIMRRDDVPGNFFDTGATPFWHLGDDYQGTGKYDPLLGLSPQDKLIGFEDVPLTQVEQMLGGLPGSFYDRSAGEWQRQMIRDLEKEKAELEEKGLNNPIRSGLPSPFHNRFRNFNRQDPRIAQIDAAIQQHKRDMDAISWKTLDQIRSDSSLQDFNDYLFKLDIQRYQEPDELVKASAEQVNRQFMDTPAYQLAFGNNNDPSSTPLERFQASPGYQFQQDEGLKQVGQQQASRGLLDSGNMLQHQQRFAQNLANQEFGRFQSQEQGLFQNWQDQLRGISSQGASLSTGQAAAQAGSQLAGIQNQLGGNLASLFGNQGTFGGSGILNTGAAQSGNLMNAASINAQIAAANAASSGGGGKGGGFLNSLGQGLGNTIAGGLF